MNLQHPPASGDAVAEALALVEQASGADIDAIEALEMVVTNLRQARAAREQLAVQVPAETLRLALLRRGEVRR